MIMRRALRLDMRHKDEEIIENKMAEERDDYSDGVEREASQEES